MKELGKRDRFYEFFKKSTMALFILAITVMILVFFIQVAKWVK
jgi:predicted RND superfamily exporter protein